MRRALTGIVSLAVLMGTATTAGAAGVAETPERAATGSPAKKQDIKDRLLAIPGMKFVSEEAVGSHRFFHLTFTQPIDHKNPKKGTFEQPLTLLHKSTSRPTVFHTSGYFLWPDPERSEPARIIDGNEISIEHRFFWEKRPAPGVWSKLTIRQAADDQHRLFTALKKLYTKKWLSTGASKGGMTATYYERFHPKDMDGVVAYVAPNDVVNKDDKAYDRFFEKVGTKKCRDLLKGLEHEALVRRGPMVKKLAAWAKANGETFKRIGSADKAYEGSVLGMAWGFWQYSGVDVCATIPKSPKKLSNDALYAALNELAGLEGGTDSGLDPFTPYYYQAGVELGSPILKTPKHLEKLVRYKDEGPRTYVPREIPMTFKPKTMADIDRFVREDARRMLFVNGEYDPWAAEPFRLGKGSKDSYVLTAPKANHGAEISWLSEKDRALATAKVLQWAGVAPASVLKDPSKAKPLAKFDARLDQKDSKDELRKRSLRP